MRKQIEELRGDTSAESLVTDCRQDYWQAKNPGRFRQDQHVTEQVLRINVADPRQSLWLVINEYNHAIFWR
jgi:hypothetical protein